MCGNYVIVLNIVYGQDPTPVQLSECSITEDDAHIKLKYVDHNPLELILLQQSLLEKPRKHDKNVTDFL